MTAMKVVDVERYALETSCKLLTHQMPDDGIDKTVAVVDFGATTTTFTVLHDLKVAYSRDMAFGGRQLTDDGSVYLGGSGDEVSSHWLEVVPAREHPKGATIRVGVTAEAFLRRAVRWFRKRGIRIESVMTDNGSCYISKVFNEALEELIRVSVAT